MATQDTLQVRAAWCEDAFFHLLLSLGKEHFHFPPDAVPTARVVCAELSCGIEGGIQL